MSDLVKLDKKPKKNRCAVCKKKVGLLGFSCSCSDQIVFCSAHRLPENHECKFDHGGHDKCVLANKLVKVVNDKVIKI